MKRDSHNRQNRGHRSFMMSPLWTRIVAGLAAVVVFSTTYWLMLPASALSRNAAADVSGLSLEQSEPEESLERLAESAETPETAEQNETEGTAADTVAGPDTEESTAKKETVSDVVAAAEEPETPAVEEKTVTKEVPAEAAEGKETTERAETAGENTAAEAEKAAEKENSVEEDKAAEEEQTTEEKKAAEEETVTEEVKAAEEEETFGSGKLFFRGNNYSVTIEYGEDAKIPSAAELRVRELAADSEEYRTHYDTAQNNAEGNGAKVRTARFFDITIAAPEKNSGAADGAESWQEIEPAAPVKVNIVFDREELELPKNAEVEVLHFADENNAETVEKEKVEVEASKGNEGTAVSGVGFDADAFSVFGVVATTIEKKVLASDGHNYRITATYNAETGIPSDADLLVEEILPADQENALAASQYDEYVSKAESALGMEEGSAGYIRLFDISIVNKEDSGVKYQPAKGTGVEVKIELADSESDELSVVHFADKDKEGSVISGSKAEGGVVSFQADGFSIYAVVGDAVLAISDITLGKGDSMTVITDLPAPVTWTSSNTYYVTVAADSTDSTKAVITGINTTTTGRTITATGANGQRNTFTVKVTNQFTSQKVYFYAVYPGVTDVSTYAPGKWLYMGDGRAYLPPSSAGSYVGDMRIDAAPNYYNNKTITVDGETFRFSTSKEAGTFEVVWDKATWSYGANNSHRWDGESGNNTTITDVRVWHIDGHLILHSATKSTVTFYAQYPEEASFRAVTEDNTDNYWPKLIPSTVLLKDIKRPEQYTTKQTSDAASASITPKKTKDSLQYQFDGWYTDAACTQRAVFDDTPVGTNNRSYYGRYIPVSGMYTVEYYYDGEKDNSATEKYLNNQVGEHIRIAEGKTYLPKDKNGRYKLDHTDPATELEIKADPAENIIKVYYTSRENAIIFTKQVEATGSLKLSDIDHTIYIALTKGDKETYVRDQYNNIIYKTITITDGVPNPARVVFEDLEPGEYNVWELTNPNSNPPTRLGVSDVFPIQGSSPQENFAVKSISGTNNATLTAGSVAETSLKNTYAKEDETPITFEANKVWIDRKANEIAADKMPENATATLSLYRKIDGQVEANPIGSITLDGNADEGDADYKEDEPWHASFGNLPRFDSNNNRITYVIKETAATPDGYYPWKQKSQNNDAYGPNDYLEHSGGTIYNRKLTVSIRLDKHFDFQPNNGEEQAVTYEAFKTDTETQKLLKFKVTLPDGTVKDYDLSDFTPKMGDTTFSLTIEDVPYFTGISIPQSYQGSVTMQESGEFELLKAYNYYVDNIVPDNGQQWNRGSAIPETVTATQTLSWDISANDPTKEIRIQNKYRRGSEGEFDKIKKKVIGLTDEDFNKNIATFQSLHFVIRNSEGYYAGKKSTPVWNPDTKRYEKLEWVSDINNATVIAPTFNYSKQDNAWVSEVNLSGFDSFPSGTYTLVEKEALEGGAAHIEGYTLEVTDNVITVKTFEEDSGAPDSYKYTLSITNKYSRETGSVEFVKTASDRQGADKVLPGATFTLYTDPECKTVAKDYPDGNDAVATSAETTGIVSFMHIPVGTYYMKETAAPEGYTAPATVYTVTIGATESTIKKNGSDEIITEIDNTPAKKKVSVWKTNEGYQFLTGAAFSLYKAEDYDDTTKKPREGKTPVVSGTVNDKGLLSLGELAVGSYRLVETQAPSGYEYTDTAIHITVSSQDVTAMQAGSQAEVYQQSNDHWVIGQDPETWQVRVWNNPGVALPSTGGPGTRLFKILGLAMMLGAGVMLFRKKKRMI